MNDHVRQLAELQALKERWKLAAMVSWLLLGFVVLGAASLVVVHHYQAQQARMQAEQQFRAAQEAVHQFLAHDLLSQAQQQLEQAKEPPPGILGEKPKE
jgi:cytoskeletal protein RodZ